MVETPYKGLMPYSEEDAALFFGREREREIISANLMASRLTLLYGASGVGKSSVLRAGVVHHLRELAQRNLAERGRPEFAVVVFSSWREDPVAGLAYRVHESVAQALNGGALEPAERPRTLADTLDALTARLDGDLLIVLDQFEEYFLYHSQEDGEGTFAVEFPRAVNRRDLRANFLISTREDALAKLDRFKGRVSGLFENYLRIDHLDREAARAAIEKPVGQYNRWHDAGGKQVALEPALVDTVLEQLQTGRVSLGEAGRGAVRVRTAPARMQVRIETPYLQLVMTRLWQEELGAGSHTLRLETLSRLGGAEQIIRTHLDNVMSGLPVAEQKAAAAVFNFLVTPSGTKIAQDLPTLAGWTQLQETELGVLLEKLSQPETRIVRPVEPPADRPTGLRFEIFHDVLAAAILDWRARFVQAQERAAAHQRIAEERQEAERRIQEQKRRAEEEARAARRLRRMLVGLAAACVVAVVAAVAAWRAESSKRRAEINAHEARGAAELRDAYLEYGNGYLTEARDDFSEALSQYQMAEDSEHELEAVKNIAEIEYAQRDYRGAEERFKKALDLYKTTPQNSGTLASILAGLARVSREQGRNRQAELYLKQALENYHGPTPQDLPAAEVSAQLASVYVDQGQYEKAGRLFSQALPLLEAAYGPVSADQDYASVLASYAVLLRKTNRNHEAESYERRVRTIQAKLNGPHAIRQAAK